MIDVRRPWLQYLRENHLKATDVLSDGTHLNPQGNYLLAEITRATCATTRLFPRPPGRIWRARYEIRRRPLLEERPPELDFEGNRIDAIASMGPAYHAEEAEVRIDGQKPSQFPELYFITRPTDTYAVDWPAVNRVTAEKPLLVEDWTMRVLETSDDDSRWRFEVTGSRTGPDGQGSSTERFVSKSGRVVIEPGEWGVKRAYDLRRQLTPVGFEVRWQVLPMFTDVYRAPRISDPSKEYAITLAQGLPNGKHTLELITRDRTNPPLRGIRVYRPPLR